MTLWKDATAYKNFGVDVFSDEVMQSRLDAADYAALRRIIDENGTLTLETAGAVAKAIDFGLNAGLINSTSDDPTKGSRFRRGGVRPEGLEAERQEVL